MPRPARIYETPRKFGGYARRVVLSALIFGFVIGGMQQLLESFYPLQPGSTGMLRLASGVVIFLAVFLLNRSSRAFSPNVLYKVGVTLISVSAVLAFLGGWPIVLTFLLICIGENFFKVFIWSSLASLSVEGEISPLATFGYGWGLHHVGILAGHSACLLYGLIVPLADFAFQIPVYVVMTLIVVLAVMFGFNDIMRLDLDPNLLRKRQRQRFEESCAALAAQHGLSQREREVFVLLAQGLSSKRIQTELVLSAGTVNTHLGHIYKKLGVHSRDEVKAFVRDFRDCPKPPPS
ncbi:MAG: helix-turn-helix transcriptional regulator [Coriobacteriales bacterium]|nr:helix-turn-helix transcriptional regulator [Coriobacteriales bacterium]